MRLQCDPVAPDVLAGVLDENPAYTLTPQAYWHRLQPHLRSFGISRVADITGLDRIGFPVAQAVRPLARSNAVTQGKALTLEGAAVGAVLECLEMAAGEDLKRLASVPAQNAEVWATYAPGLARGTAWPDDRTEFIACRNVSGDTNTTLPRDLISTDFRQDAPAAQAPILRHSIGLGAGTTFAAAFMHGLLECIEADARNCDEAYGGAQRMMLDDGDGTYGEVLARIQQAGLRVAVYDLPCKGGVMAVKASIMEAPGATALPLPATGYGARTTYREAIAAALAEATQARLAVISGAREDITQRFYTHGASLADLESEWDRHGPAQLMIENKAVAPLGLQQIAQSVGPVFAVPLHWNANLRLAIVRVVVPNLITDPMRLETL
jgi:ribosomal protein S12 methylthiotransferase accessory factor